LTYSIIIPTYNREETIIRTLKSIISQTYKEIEIIVIDDFSSDNTLKLLKDFKENNKGIDFKYYHLKSNKGPNIAKNFGSKNALGNYLIFLDSDDCFYDNNSLFNINEELGKNNYPNLGMFTSFYISEKIAKKPKFSNLQFKEFLRNKNIGEFLPVVKKQIFLDFPFFKTIIGGEGLTWLKITKESGYIFYSEIVVRLYDDFSENRLSTFSSSFKKRLYNIQILFIKEFWVDFLKYYPYGLFKNLIKIIYYGFPSYKK